MRQLFDQFCSSSTDFLFRGNHLRRGAASVPAGAERGGHSHKEQKEFLIALSGSFDVILNDGKVEKLVTLNKPFEGLLITNGIWRELKNFSSGAVCLVVATDVFEEADYIRDFDDFLAISNQ